MDNLAGAQNLWSETYSRTSFVTTINPAAGDVILLKRRVDAKRDGFRGLFLWLRVFGPRCDRYQKVGVNLKSNLCKDEVQPLVLDILLKASTLRKLTGCKLHEREAVRITVL